MCLICSDLLKNKLTIEEARSNLNETYMDMDKDHVYEILRLLWQKEDEQYEVMKDDGSD